MKKVLKKNRKKKPKILNGMGGKRVCIEDCLLDQIVGKTIYKERDLNALFSKARKKYFFMPEEEVESAILEVKTILEN